MKLIKTLIALLFLALVFSVLGVIVLVKFNNKSSIGKFIKGQFINYPLLVDLAGLDEPGDYRYKYVDNSYQQVQVILVSGRGVEIDDQASVWLSEMLKQTVNKDARISVRKDALALQDLYSNEDLNKIRVSVAENYNVPALYVIYLSKYEEKPGLAGITLHKDTIFIFKRSLEELNENEQLVDRLERSTIMHEWAHLLGVEHIDDEGCIMSGKINVYENPDSWKGFIPIEYCSFTLYEIERLRNR